MRERHIVQLASVSHEHTQAQTTHSECMLRVI
uniref:Uncharacterized protein n=1 Tax=Ciona intestinalis TaxID=7719 RepID=H2XNQ3_CIOIN